MQRSRCTAMMRGLAAAALLVACASNSNGYTQWVTGPNSNHNALFGSANANYGAPPARFRLLPLTTARVPDRCR